MKTKISLSVLLAIVCCVVMHAQQKPLKFNADKKFKIVQIADVHYVWKDTASEEAIACINKILDIEKPDLVVYTGDLTASKAPAREAITRVVTTAASRKIPFAVTLGNHDDEQDLNRVQLFEVLKTIPYNRTETVAGLSGVTNFILPIQGSVNAKNEAVLYFLDTHAYPADKKMGSYDWLKLDQINWYVQQSKAFTAANDNKPLPALAFFHIPLPEYNLAASDEKTKLIGSRMEKACAPELNTGMFTAMLESGDVMATFVGHDHDNNYLAYWKGIVLGYGQFSGTYKTYNNLPEGRGARVIELEEGQRAFKTYIRLENGTVIHSVDCPVDFLPKKQ